MNAAVVHSFSAPPRYESFAEPVPAGEEILLTVTAAGLHPIVKSLAAGTHYSSARELPFVAGLDGVGHLPDGKRVYFARSQPVYGSFAERSVTRRVTCLPIPEPLSDATVAAMMNPGMSSWGALTERTQLAPGESILILGATGVAGQLAVQVAKRLGARRVVAAGRNPQALKELRELGADRVLSLAQDHAALVAAFRGALTEERIDLVLDYVWGAPAEAALEAMTLKGAGAMATRFATSRLAPAPGPGLLCPRRACAARGWRSWAAAWAACRWIASSARWPIFCKRPLASLFRSRPRSRRWRRSSRCGMHRSRERGWFSSLSFAAPHRHNPGSGLAGKIHAQPPPLTGAFPRQLDEARGAPHLLRLDG
ncbi:MAG TPA: zinc-binding alcohol dehydrogenase family protein [Acidobacteriaceae bacterium]|nr:zinc-binding alcohol dehydrogenase family protein [Acidobacteriaceae bacterium]